MRVPSRPRVAGLVLAALAGLAVAVILSVLASSLSTQPIGISGELRAGQGLAPRVVVTTRTQPARHPTPASKPVIEAREHEIGHDLDDD